MELTFTRFSLQPCSTSFSHDRVELYDGTGTHALARGIYCGTTLPGVLLSSDRSLYVAFRTDSSLVGTGFAASYRIGSSRTLPLRGATDARATAVPPERICNSDLPGFHATSALQYITDGREAASNYASYANCVAVVSAPPGQRVEFTFTRFSLQEPVEGECVDWVEVSAVTVSSVFEALGRYCGTALPPTLVSPRVAADQYDPALLRVHFRSGPTVSGTGFAIGYRAGAMALLRRGSALYVDG